MHIPKKMNKLGDVSVDKRKCLVCFQTLIACSRELRSYHLYETQSSNSPLQIFCASLSLAIFIDVEFSSTQIRCCRCF